MNRNSGESSASPTRWCFLLLSFIIGLCAAGPLGPLPNVTSVDLGLKENSCALGDVVYMSGDEFPGASACEKCKCSGGNVACEKQICEPRPGCKAVHRPDHCCPTYQCECEQEGRVYGNGEKLIDPQDPCRVCYCQGGEVVCRRIACFVRDDCQPRLVAGRCCPEYDNCPLRGVTTLQGITTPTYTTTTTEISMSLVPVAEPAKPEITIKEITPVSEIPFKTDVKVKEIIPSSMDMSEYTSSKSQVIPREAAVDGSSTFNDLPKHETPLTEVSLDTKLSTESFDFKDSNNTSPAKINLSTQDLSDSALIPSKIPTMAIFLGSPAEPAILNPQTTKSPIIEEEDPSLFDHNPAFPPIPDDLSVIGNHEDEILPELNVENEHTYVHATSVASHHKISTESPIIIESTSAGLLVSSELFNSDNSSEGAFKTTTTNTDFSDSTTLKENSMLNLRSVLPTEILNLPSLIPDDDSTIENDGTTEVQVTNTYVDTIITTTHQTAIQLSDMITKNPINLNIGEVSATTDRISLSSENTFSTIARNRMATNIEITSEKHPSSLLIETSDQNPHDVVEKILDETFTSSTSDPYKAEQTSETVTQSKALPEPNISLENVETTEFIISPYGSQESVTDNVELIKMIPDTEKKSPLLDTPKSRKDDLLINDLIKLVGDVASISNRTDATESEHGSIPTTISDSEELIPVNAGYKSKNNNNWNLNSITEVPFKTKTSQNKQKIIEIEDDGVDGITDFPPPHDKIEPTTKEPIIDNVSDPQNKTKSKDRKDFEIITKSYVPTINRKPTKVVMEKSDDKISSEVTTGIQDNPSSTPGMDDPITSLSEFTTQDGFSSTEVVTEVGSLENLGIIE
ncbi:uncharacterized protein LOC126964436 [Leptidea sinapis]|uniref:uncharacterized protein LOC126964436 n=1 Tax=Leptidea sinapis TaxID=189913 RepID=UPI00212BB16B|nr:uncharacterized protein LOC126964436 [Leptidea sinapis]